MTRFSPTFKTFSQWLLAQPRTSRYAKRIIKLHSLAPKATLNALRSLPLREVALWLKPFLKLTSDQKDLRHRALMVRAEMLDGTSITEASKFHGIKPSDVIKHLGKFIYRKGRRWYAKKNCNVQRARWFFSKGKRISVIIDNDETASLISKYLHAVKHTLIDGDVSRLEPYKKITVIDVDGKKHPFETDFATLQDLDLMIEDRDSLHIYDDRV